MDERDGFWLSMVAKKAAGAKNVINNVKIHHCPNMAQLSMPLSLYS